MSKFDIDRPLGVPPTQGHPTDLVPPWELRDAPFADPESLSRAQMRLIRKAEKMTCEGKIIVGDDNRRLAMWQNLWRIFDAHKDHEPGRYYPARARRPPRGRPRGDRAPAGDARDVRQGVRPLLGDGQEDRAPGLRASGPEAGRAARVSEFLFGLGGDAARARAGKYCGYKE